MVDLIYPLKKDTLHDCRELLFSLRSVEKHLSNVGTVYIVSESLPHWITNVELIYCKDYVGANQKEFNIATKICAACLLPKVSDPLLFLNDDHYLLSDYDASTFPYYYFDHIQRRIKVRKPTEIYYKSLFNTEKVLKEAHRDTKYFDIHSPILYEKEQFIRIMKNLSWHDNCGYVIKSLYSNMMYIPGEEYSDMKLKPPFDEKLLKDRLWFSNNNLVLRNPFWKWMENTFPNKSKYEI